MHPKTTAPEPVEAPAAAGQPRCVGSDELLRGQSTLLIEHAGQRYLLRVTRENKLILTK